MSFINIVNTIGSIISLFPPIFTTVVVAGLIVLVCLAVKRVFF